MRITDSQIRAGLIEQTADLRYSIKSQGLRELLAQHGHDAMQCVQIGCDQGNDVSIDLVLGDATAIRMNYREHYRTRQAIRITDWELLTYSDREMEMAKNIVSHNDNSFDKDVRTFFDEIMAGNDSSLPPLKWGDRMWHAFESPPD